MTGSQRWTLVAAILGSGIVFLDGTIVNLALPAIGRLPTTFVGVLEGQAYVVSGYLAVLVPDSAGALSARRPTAVFGFGLLAFGTTSTACNLAPTMGC
jgi:hypothetical protein